MASLTKKRGSVAWIACFTDAAGVQRQRSTGLKDEGDPAARAENRRKAIEVAQGYEFAARGDRTEAQIRKSMTDLFARVSGKRLEWATVRPFLTSWLDRTKLRKTSSTHARYKTVVDGFLASLGAKESVPLGDITTEDVQQYVDAQLKKGKRAGTLRVETKILNAAFRYAHRQGLIIFNPVVAADIPSDASERKRPFTWAQIRKLIRTCTLSEWEPNDRIVARLPDWKTATLIGAYASARIGDATNLRWRNIDFQERVIRFRPAKTQRKAKDVVMPMHPALEAHLLTLTAPDDPNAYVTPTLAGLPVGGRPGLSRQFQRIMDKAGIENETLAGGKANGGRRFQALGFHSLRTTFVSELANAGVEQDLRMALSSHDDKRVHELYTHRGISTLRAAVEKLKGL